MIWFIPLIALATGAAIAIAIAALTIAALPELIAAVLSKKP
jgi:hypothetical protein